MKPSQILALATQPQISSDNSLQLQVSIHDYQSVSPKVLVAGHLEACLL
jgi:hypothetical protein